MRRIKFEPEEEERFNPELERLKMLKQWAFLAGLLIVIQFGIAVVMYPQAVGVIGSLGIVGGTMGFAAGRHLHRKDQEQPSINIRKTQEALERIEDDLTKRVQDYHRENSVLQKMVTHLEDQCSREKTARQSAQRELIEHMRDCHE